MRPYLLLLCGTLLCVAVASAEAPFTPIAPVPDYVVITEDRSIRLKPPVVRTVMRHGAWTRIDTVRDARLTREYVTAAGPLTITLYHDAAGDIAAVSLLRGREPQPRWDDEPHKTSAHETLVGETCTVWDVGRSRQAVGVTQLSCVTDDGIELWRKWMGVSGPISVAAAIRIERRPVAPDEAQPPRDLLKLDRWTPASRPPGEANADTDYEVELARDAYDGTHLTRTTRRHGGWTFVEEMAGTARRHLSVTNPAARVAVNFVADATGASQRLTISRLQDGPTPAAMAPKDLDRGEQIAGEACEWFDVMPGAMDAGAEECRTRDGITLKSVLSSRGRAVETLTAVRLSRRPIGLDAVMPPPALLDPKSWGLD